MCCGWFGTKKTEGNLDGLVGPKTQKETNHGRKESQKEPLLLLLFWGWVPILTRTHLSDNVKQLQRAAKMHGTESTW